MSKPTIYSFCEAGCKWEVPHKSELEETNDRLDKHITNIAYVTATTSTAGGVAVIMLSSDIINTNSFIEVFGANGDARGYLQDNLRNDYNPLLNNGLLTIYVTQTFPSAPETLQYVVKVTKLESGSAVYIHI